MQVILLKDLNRIGDKHDVVTVKNGYGRNFLIPKKVAVIANDANMAKLDKLKAEEAAKEAARLDEYKELATKLEGKTIKIGVKSGTSGKIFGSVTNIQVANALKEQLQIEVERKKVALPEEIDTVGSYPAKLNLHPEVTATITLELIKE